MSENDDDDVGKGVSIRAGSETFIYAPDTECMICGGESVGVVKIVGDMHSDHGAVCSEHKDGIEEDNKASDITFKPFP